jgi:2-keto-4-pentenoate hydratase/2-oxohepta-3-ene-1,7-dioic acid hydratase in catechol pathway
MKIARYIYNNCYGYGFLYGESIIDLPALSKNLDVQLPSSIEGFITGGNTTITMAEALIENASKSELDYFSISCKKVKLLAPLVFPPKILCLGWNYIDHNAETKTQVPAEPVVFMKPHTAIIGPGEKIIKRPFVKELDYEGELAIVIGKMAKDVSESEALDYIFGYTIFNDVSARDFQFKDKQWTRGKGFDTFAPIGPCIVTRDELTNTTNVGIRTWINGEQRQNGSTKDMVFNICQIIYHLSQVMTLEPCDVIATGTPSGVGMAMNPKVWLKHGDKIRIEIDNIGTLENVVEEY